jgi:hypothetical protein
VGRQPDVPLSLVETRAGTMYHTFSGMTYAARKSICFLVYGKLVVIRTRVAFV